MTDQATNTTTAGGSPLDGGVRPDAGSWKHLLRYGYAPGHYMNTCRRCGEVVHDVDKRAWCCRACAEARHAYEQPPCYQCGAMSAEEAETNCLGAAAGDDCHGNQLWPD